MQFGVRRCWDQTHNDAGNTSDGARLVRGPDADGTYNNGGGSSEEQVPGEGTWFYLTDVQFSVVALLDDIAVLSERVRYDAYGRARHRWPADLDGDGDSDSGDHTLQLAAASTAIHASGYVRPRLRRRST